MTRIYRLKATLMRGGTSKGLFFREDALPNDPELIQTLLLRAMGSPDPYGKQMDGLGTGLSTTSKVAIISPSRHQDCDIDYLFGHVSIGKPHIDWSGSCGNLTAAVPLFAIQEGLVPVRDGKAEVRIWQANIGKRILAELEINNGQAVWTGDYRIDGIAFPGAHITLRFLDPAGGASGQLFPTGQKQEKLSLPNGSELNATLIDAGNPTVFVAADSLGLSGSEKAEELTQEVLASLEYLRAHAAVRMGLANSIETASQECLAIPKISFISRTKEAGIHLNARILSMERLHHAYTGTGAIALAAASAIKGTLAADMLQKPLRGQPLCFSHASGRQTLHAKMIRQGRSHKIVEVTMQRTARPLMMGEVLIPLEV